MIDAGDTVVATARNPSTLSFENTSSKNYLALKLDVTDSSSLSSPLPSQASISVSVSVSVSASPTILGALLLLDLDRYVDGRDVDEEVWVCV